MLLLHALPPLIEAREDRTRGLFILKLTTSLHQKILTPSQVFNEVFALATESIENNN
jgi:hypothetical protein